MTAPTLSLTSTPDLIAERLVRGSLQISESLQRRTLCTFRLLLEPAASWPGLNIGQPITLTDGTDLLFSGTVDSDDSDELLVGEGYIEQSVTCVDLSQILDRFVVAADYQQMLAGDVVRDILTNRASSSITDEVGTGKALQVGQLDDGPTIDVLFNYSPVRAALDEIVELTGLSWLLSPGGELSFQARDAGTPITGADLSGLRLSRSRTRQQLRTRQFVRGGRGLSSQRLETFEGDGEQRSFTLALPVGAVPTIEVDGAEKTVGIRGAEVDHEWYWSSGDPQISQDPAGTTLTAEQSLEVRFQHLYPIFNLATDESAKDAREQIEGGTGLYENMETDDRIDTSDLAFDRAEALLRRFGDPEEVLTIRADSASGPSALLAGRPGQLLTVQHDALEIDGEYLVESVTTSDLEGLHLERSWELREGEAYGGWTTWFRQLAAQRRGELTLRADEGVHLVRASSADEVQITDTISATEESAIARIGTARVGFSQVAA